MSNDADKTITKLHAELQEKRNRIALLERKLARKSDELDTLANRCRIQQERIQEKTARLQEVNRLLGQALGKEPK